MIFSRLLLFSLYVMTLAACEGPGSKPGTKNVSEADLLTAASLGEQVVLPTADYLKLPRYKKASVDYGHSLAAQCLVCHSFDEAGSGGRMGPNLHGLFGRRAGSVNGYPYSPALRKAGFTWTPRALDAWLAQPVRFLPGNRMGYAGMPNPEDRNAVIAELLRRTEAAASGAAASAGAGVVE